MSVIPVATYLPACYFSGLFILRSASMTPNPNSTAAVRGDLFIISAPSGAGKTSLVKAVVERLNASGETVRFSTSSTTRPMRPGEQDGSDYHFLTADDFRQQVAAENFLEHAEVFDNLYGTSRSGVYADLDAGFDVILEIDWQGAQQVRARAHGAVSVFILPPSLTELENRLNGRGSDSAEVIARRMRDARREIEHHGEFEYLIVNDDFDRALRELESLFIERRLQAPSQRLRYSAMLDDLLAGGGS